MGIPIKRKNSNDGAQSLRDADLDPLVEREEDTQDEWTGDEESSPRSMEHRLSREVPHTRSNRCLVRLRVSCALLLSASYLTSS